MTTGTTRRSRWALFAAFASLGVTASLFPAALPAAEHAVSGDLSGAIPTLFAGLLIGVLSVGPLMRSFGTRVILIIGGVLQTSAISVAALSAAPMTFLSAAAVAGFGFGLVEASGSVSAKAVTGGDTTGMLSALTGTLAVAAAVTPLFVAAVGATFPMLGLLALVPLGAVALLSSATDPAPARHEPPRLAMRQLIPLLPIAVALPLYVGVETVISGWSAVIPERALAVEPATAALGTSVFWALMASGRFGAAGLRRRGVRPLVILSTGTLGAALLLCAAGLLIAAHPVLALTAVATSVIALAPSYGLILGIALDRLDEAHSAGVTGALVACGAVGGAFVPAGILLIGRDPASALTFIFCAVLCGTIPALVGIRARSLPRRR